MVAPIKPCPYCNSKMGEAEMVDGLFLRSKCTNKECKGELVGNAFFGFAWTNDGGKTYKNDA